MVSDEDEDEDEDKDKDEDEDEDEDEELASDDDDAATPRSFGTGWEKKTKDNTPAKAVRAIKAMATTPNRLFIFCLTT